MWRSRSERIWAAALAASRTAGTMTVTNEVGWGVVPVSTLARRYVDPLGRVNAIWARAADQAVLVVAGRVLPLEAPGAIVGARGGD